LPTTGEKQVPKPFTTALLTVGLNIQDLEMPNETDNENDALEVHHVANQKELPCIGNSLQCYTGKEHCEEADEASSSDLSSLNGSLILQSSKTDKIIAAPE
jgi:hypothetical protein